jgi:NTP pyrophosphatase (non-canonical NTP hydrolase)
MDNMYVGNLNKIASEIAEYIKAKGFVTPDNIDDPNSRVMMLGKLMLVVTEVSEAAEAARDGDKDHFEEELADIIIRVLGIAAACRIDLEDAIQQKMFKNEKRPFKHGRECII